MTTTNIHNRLRERRIAQGISQIALAAKAGISISTISRAERWGFRLSPVTAERVAAALNSEALELFPYLAGEEARR